MKWKRVISILLTLFIMMGVLFVYIGYYHPEIYRAIFGTYVVAKNESGKTIRILTISGRGFSLEFHSIPPKGEDYLRLRPDCDSGFGVRGYFDDGTPIDPPTCFGYTLLDDSCIHVFTIKDKEVLYDVMTGK